MTAFIFVNRYFYPDHSATSQLLSDVAFQMAAAGKDIRVITSRQIYDNPQARLPRHETVHSVNVYRVWTSYFGRQQIWGRSLDYVSFYFGAAWRLWRLARKGDVVIAKTDPPLISVPAMLVARLRGASTLNWLQDLFPEVASALQMRGMKPIAPLLRRIRNASLKNAKLNIVLGERMAKCLRGEGIPENQIRVIHNWSDGRNVRPVAKDANEMRRAWGLADRFVVGYSGNMGRAHEFETVLGAAERLMRDPRILFLFIGGGAKRAWLERQCATLGLTNVEFKPYQPRASLAESLSVPDVHLISLYPNLEGLIVPSKFYGIAAAGRPIVYIGDNDGEVPRLLREGHCGYTCAPGDTAGLADVLAKLAAEPTELSRLGVNARALFDDRFDKSVAMQAWRKLLS